MGCGRSAEVARPRQAEYQLAESTEASPETEASPRSAKTSGRFRTPSLFRLPALRAQLTKNLDVTTNNGPGDEEDCDERGARISWCAYGSFFAVSDDRFRALDALRGFACMCVLYGHMCGFMHGWRDATLKGQYLAVDFFQVLSGFVLTNNYMPPKKAYITTPHVVGYRIARLFPLHWLAVWMTWYCRWYVGPEDWRCWDEASSSVKLEVSSRVQELFFLQSLGLPLKYCNNNVPSWSLSCEFWISVAFAFVIKIPIPKFFLLAFGVWGQWQTYCHHASLNQRRHGGFIRCLSSFVYGILSHQLYKSTPKLAEKWIRTYPTGIEASLCMLIYFIVWDRPQTENRMDYWGPPVFIVTVVCFAFEAGCVSKALRFGEFIGTISYSIYLTHWSILEWMSVHGNLDHIKHAHFNCFLRLCFIVLPFSVGTYFLFEKPANKLIRTFVDNVLAGTTCDPVLAVAENAQVDV